MVIQKKDTPKKGKNSSLFSYKEPKKADDTNKENASVNESARDETLSEICNLSTVINPDTVK